MDGGVAQLGEHLPCKQGVMGSIPIISTTGQARTQHRGKRVPCGTANPENSVPTKAGRSIGQSPDPMIGVESAMRFFSPRESRSDGSRKGKGRW